MKKLFTLFLTLTVFNAVNAQWITGLSVWPPNPTTTDQIHIIADVEFPSGDCQDKTLTQSNDGQTFDLHALHCVGMLTFICSSADTFHLNMLPAGTYTARFQVDMGAGPSPCTPGIVAGPMDSIVFTVTTSTGFSNPDQDGFELFPNPGKEGFTLKFSGSNSQMLVKVTDLSGRLVMEKNNVGSGVYFDLHEMSAGAYLVEIYEGTTLINKRKWVKD